MRYILLIINFYLQTDAIWSMLLKLGCTKLLCLVRHISARGQPYLSHSLWSGRSTSVGVQYRGGYHTRQVQVPPRRQVSRIRGTSDAMKACTRMTAQGRGLIKNNRWECCNLVSVSPGEHQVVLSWLGGWLKNHRQELFEVEPAFSFAR